MSSGRGRDLDVTGYTELDPPERLLQETSAGDEIGPKANEEVTLAGGP